MENVSIIVAHPDDETIGCGGTILKYLRKGHKVNLLVLSDGISSRSVKKKDIEFRKNNFLNAMSQYNGLRFEVCDFPDNQFDTVPLLSIIKRVEKFISQYKTSTIITHFFDDLNIDHRITSQSVITATRPVPNNKINKILMFEVPSSTNWNCSSTIFKPNYYVDIKNFFEKKKNILKLYKNEIPRNTHTRSISNLKNLTEIRGGEVGLKNAEAFFLFREIKL